MGKLHGHQGNGMANGGTCYPGHGIIVKWLEEVDSIITRVSLG